jgi:hypothetical protein
MNGAEACASADRADPAMGSATIEPAAVATDKYRAGRSLADGEVDRAGGPWNERDDGWLVALADDLERAVPRSKPRSSCWCRRLR